MITPKNRDMNRSRDVEGPTLKRSYDQEHKEMKDKSLFHDSAPTGVIEKHSLADLHHGDHEAPLTALGEQHVVVKSPMGQDHPDHLPMTSKGSTKDQSHHGHKSTEYVTHSKSAPKTGRESSPKGMGRSAAGKAMGAMKSKAGY
jgi:hypothetical protein